MKFHHLLLCLLPILTVSRLAAQQVAPAKALTYHEALLKHPHNATVFSRFYDAWIDSESLESLETFLKNRAESDGGIHYALLARYQLRRGRDAEALLSLNKAIESTPADPALLMERSNLLSRSLDFPTARKDLESVTTLGNETLAIEASKLIGKSHLREGNPQAAIQAWENLLTTHPGNEDLLEDLVELAASADQTAQALSYSEKLIASSTDPYKKALRLIRRGELLSNSGNNDLALAVWTDTLTQTGEGSWLEREILAHIEQSFRRLDRLDLYTAKLEELAKAHPRRLLIHRELAKQEAASGNIDSAIGRFREVLRRSPGEEELREEFIRLLIQSERFDDASAELGKMLAASPGNAELHLRLAEFTYQKSRATPDLEQSPASAEILKSLDKALGLLDPGEASGLRIAHLMIRYELGDEGEALLQKLSTQPGASSAPAESLAAEYIRTKRSAKALDILTELAKSPEIETVLRATSAMAPLAKPETAFHILQSRLPEFQNNNLYLTAFIQASLSAKKPADAIPSALRLVRSSKLGQEIHDAVQLAKTTVIAAEKSPELVAELSAIESRSTSETCLLAVLLETRKEHEKSDALLRNTTDPVLLRFHSSLLSARGDFKAAIATLTQLAESSTNAGPSYFKELSDLQLRAGDTQACLKTLEQWKIASPTDKTPWTIATRLLRESAQYPKAIESARRALSRFPNDEDLTAILADLHQQTGEHAEAERLYWKLYDQAADPSAQSRWAARLATLAQSQGRTAEIKENFLQRSRGNRQSIGPILSLIELARATHNEKEVLEHLYQALRIKPTDIDIRLQVATAEKQSGNLEKQISVLNEGMSHDSASRLRTVLAQAFIDQGQTIKGMRMLRALSGDQASDPRLIESAAISIANSGMISEAIQYLQESLPIGMDWRTRFLLASLLQGDGREVEAADLYLTLLDENTEIPGLIPSTQAYYLSQRTRLDQSSEFQNFSLMMQFISQEAYQERRFQNRPDFQRMLPTLPAEVRFRSLARLASLANLKIPALTAKINGANIPDLPFAADVITHTAQGGTDYPALLEKHADRPGFLFYLLQQGYNFDDPKKSKTSLLDTLQRLKDAPGIDDKTRLALLLRTLYRHPSHPELWEELVTLTEKNIQSDPGSTDESGAEALFSLLGAHKTKTAIPAALLPRMKNILLRYAQRHSEEDTNPERKNTQALQMSIHGLFGEVEPWIEMANAAITTHRGEIDEYLENIRKEWSARPQRGIYLQAHTQSYFSHTLPITSLPRGHMQVIAPAKSDPKGYHMSGSWLAASDLLPHLNKLESPLFRAWIAIQSGDEKAIRKAMAVKVPAIEADDFRILEAYLHFQSDMPAQTCRSLLALMRSSADKPWISYWARSNFLSFCLQLPPDQRKEFDPAAREILLSLHTPVKQPLNPLDTSPLQSIAEAASRLGFDDIQKSITDSLIAASAPTQPRSQSPPSQPASGVTIGKPAAITPARTAQPRPLTAIDRYRNFSGEGKHRAAAHELLMWMKKQKQSGYEIERTLAEAKTTPQVRDEILALSDPGTAPGLTKRLEYVAICQALGESAKALATLQTLATERPFDARITAALAFALPPEDIETAACLLKDMADSPELSASIQEAHRRASGLRKNDQTFAFFELLSRFLELAEPIPRLQHREDHSFNQMVYSFFSGSSLQSIPSLFRKGETPKEETLDILKHREISQKITRAMLRLPAHAEFAFRAMRAAQWIETPTDTDTLARNCLLFDTAKSTDRDQFEPSLPEFASTRWLCGRIKEPVPQETLLPADFLTALAANDPVLPKLLVALYQTRSAKDINALWESGVMTTKTPPNSPVAILQEAVLEKIATVPGATDFFAARIGALAKDGAWKTKSTSTGEYEHAFVFKAALLACRNQTEKDIGTLCSSIATTLYGKNPEPKAIAQNQEANNLIQGIFNNLSTDHVTAVRITQAFDSLTIPMNAYWLSNSLRQDRITDPAQAIAWFESIGFLKDTSEWHPLAHYRVKSQSDSMALTQSHELERVHLGQDILQNLDYRIRTKEFAAQLANRQPTTFGALITASAIATSSSEQDGAQLALQAFQHAARHLAKAPAKRLDDFTMVVHLLPFASIRILPPHLQTAVKLQRDSQVAGIRKQIEEQFRYLAQSQGRNALKNLQSQIILLAPFDPDAAIQVFREARQWDQKNGVPPNANGAKSHRQSLNYVMRAILQNKNSDPTHGFQFYRAIRKDDQKASFGITDGSSAPPYLGALGEAMEGRFYKDIPENTPRWLRPWITANRITGEYHNDALAAATCISLINRSMVPMEQAAKLLDTTQGLSDKTRELALRCQSIHHFGKTSPDYATNPEQSFIRMLEDPDFDSDTRLQIAYSTVYGNPKILNNPVVAAAFASVFIPHCAGDFSVVDPMTLRIVQSMADMEPTPEALPHLRKINEAFWTNANTPKSDLHASIDEQSAVRLLLASIRIDDLKHIKLLLPHVRASLVGNLNIIVPLILSDQFQIACELIPDEASSYSTNSQTAVTYNDALIQKLDAFAAFSPNPTRALRLECQLIQRLRVNGGSSISEKIASHTVNLIARYQENKPKDLASRIELLSILTAGSLPVPLDLNNEICELAATMDARQVALQRMRELKSSSGRDHPTAHSHNILRTAAMIRFLDGDPALFVALCDAITSLLNESSQEDRYHLESSTQTFIQSTYRTVVQAVSENKTKAFPAIIRPLRDLALAVLASRSGSMVLSSIALHDFVSHWENQPEDLSDHLRKWDNKDLQRAIESIQFPRKTFPFIETLATMPGSAESRYGDDPRQLIIAILSRPSLGKLLPSESSWLKRMQYRGCEEILPELAKSPPESATPEGRLLLRLFQHDSQILSGSVAIEANQEILKNIPSGPQWNSIRITCQLKIANEMISEKHDVAEIRALFDSIDADHAKKNNYQIYRAIEVNLESAEALLKKESP